MRFIRYRNAICISIIENALSTCYRHATNNYNTNPATAYLSYITIVVTMPCTAIINILSIYYQCCINMLQIFAQCVAIMISMICGNRPCHMLSLCYRYATDLLSINYCMHMVMLSILYGRAIKMPMVMVLPMRYDSPAECYSSATNSLSCNQLTIYAQRLIYQMAMCYHNGTGVLLNDYDALAICYQCASHQCAIGTRSIPINLLSISYQYAFYMLPTC